VRIEYAVVTFLLYILVSLISCEPAADDKNLARIQIPEMPDSLRIVTLAPHLAELVSAAGAGNFLVGVSDYSDYPKEISELPVIGDAFVVDQEQLALLNPDMLLVWQSGTPEYIVDELSKQGYRVEIIQTRSLEDIASALDIIGELTGNKVHAAQVAEDFRQGLQTLADRYSTTIPVRVFYQLQKRPLYTISGDHYISELIELCGGQNIFSDLVNLAPLVTVEAVIERNPEVLLVSSDSRADALSEWDRWTDLAANRYDNRYVIPANEISRPVPRLLIAGEALCNALQQGRTNRNKYAFL
jgi:iron complex transport system substrate-binding protein